MTNEDYGICLLCGHVFNRGDFIYSLQFMYKELIEPIEVPIESLVSIDICESCARNGKAKLFECWKPPEAS